jgi:putative RNA 2'-phosphotransferase
MTPRQIKISKYLSFVLRHDPAAGGIVLDAEGWVAVDDLLSALSGELRFTRAELIEAVQVNDKQRFALSPDGSRIRANQGHSVTVALGYEPQTPPEMLFHGTAEKFIGSIRTQGLIKGRRQQVHLSVDRDTAVKVGQRHGLPVVLEVRAWRMHRDGFVFFLSENGVWLTETVPVKYLVMDHRDIADAGTQ